MFLYVSRLYLKYFVIIFLALVLFFVGFDFIQKVQTLPDSANLKLLFVVYNTFFAMDLLFPVALLFALIGAKLTMIRSNELVAFYSLGHSKQALLKPFFITALLLTLFFMFLNMTPFAYAQQYAKNIRKSGSLSSVNSNLFFKYDVNSVQGTESYYVYFGRLNPLKKVANNIRIFKVYKEDLQELMRAHQAVYKDGHWEIINVHIIQKPQNIDYDSSGILVLKENRLELLEGFKPKILDQVYEGKVRFTIIDAIDAILLLRSQNVNIDKIKTALYEMVIFPFFAPLFVVVLFVMLPISARMANLTIVSFGTVLLSILLWGMFFAFVKFSMNGTIAPEYTILLPVALIGALSIFVYRRNFL